MLFLAMVLDVLDGKIAGILKQKNLFGRQIDSMSDLVSFGVAPAMLFYALSSPGIIGIIVAFFFVASDMTLSSRTTNLTANKYFKLDVKSHTITNHNEHKLQLPLRKSAFWYDFSVKVKGQPDFS